MDWLVTDARRVFFNPVYQILSFGLVVIEKSIDTAICAFAFTLFQRTRADERQRPVLELEFVELSQAFRTLEIGWLTFFVELDFFAKCVLQSALDQIDRKICDIDPDPLSSELLRSVNRRAASTKRIEHDIARIT